MLALVVLGVVSGVGRWVWVGYPRPPGQTPNLKNFSSLAKKMRFMTVGAPSSITEVSHLCHLRREEIVRKCCKWEEWGRCRWKQSIGDTTEMFNPE